MNKKKNVLLICCFSKIERQHVFCLKTQKKFEEVMENQQLSLKPIVYPKILKVYICLYIIKVVICGGNERNYRY